MKTWGAAEMHTLRRTTCAIDGIHGVFTFEGDAQPFMETLEHAFQGIGADWDYHPLIPPGIYTCVRGMHQLAHGDPFEAFEITGVAGHSGLLFHAGNFNCDSHGCVLCGQEIKRMGDGIAILTGSRNAFAAFMNRLTNVEAFQLEMIGG